MNTQLTFTQLWDDGPRYTAGNAFPLSTDSILLADFVLPKKHCYLADFGCGSGILGLLIKYREPSVRLKNIDILQDALDTARSNMRANHLDDEVEYCRADFQELRGVIPAHSLDLIVCNPPYFSAASGELSPYETRKVARSEINCSMDSLLRSSSISLRSGGRICMVHRPDRLTELMTTMNRYRIEPKRIRFVQHSIHHKASLILIEGRYEGNPGLQVDPVLVLHEHDGTMTQEAKRIYHQA